MKIDAKKRYSEEETLREKLEKNLLFSGIFCIQELKTEHSLKEKEK